MSNGHWITLFDKWMARVWDVIFETYVSKIVIEVESGDVEIEIVP